jgi:hypothetical protein
VQSGPTGREVLADERHRQVARVAPPELLGQEEAVEPRRVGPVAHLVDEREPLGRGRPVVPVRACRLPPVIEELGVLGLEGFDLRLDELVEVGE